MGNINNVHLGAWGVAIKTVYGETDDATTRFFASRGLNGKVPFVQGAAGDGEIQIPYQVLTGGHGISGLLRFRDNGEIVDGLVPVDPGKWLVPSVMSTRLLIQLAFGSEEFSYKPTDYEADLLSGAAELYQCLTQNNNDANRCTKEVTLVTKVKEAEEKRITEAKDAEKKRQEDQIIASYDNTTRATLEFANKMVDWARKEDVGWGGIDPDDILPLISQYSGQRATYSAHTVEDANMRKYLAGKMLKEMIQERDTGWKACVALKGCKREYIEKSSCGADYTGSRGTVITKYWGEEPTRSTYDSCERKKEMQRDPMDGAGRGRW